MAETLLAQVKTNLSTNNVAEAKNALEQIHQLVAKGIATNATEAEINQAAVDATTYGEALKAYLSYLLTSMNKANDELTKSNSSSEELRKYATNLLKGIENVITS